MGIIELAVIATTLAITAACYIHAHNQANNNVEYWKD